MEGNSRYHIGVDINSNQCEKQKKPAKDKIQIGTMRCLRPDNEVTDVEAASTTSQSSRISEIMKCMFFKKKETEVVEMKPEKSSVSKKQSLTLDRSERSRRVLKMESMREAPLERDALPPDRPLTPPAAKRFLPSEDPTAAFLGYVNPQNRQIRRAYSDVIRATNTPSSKKQLQAREAFVVKQESQRNTNYRANRATEQPNAVKEFKNDEDDDQQDLKDSDKPRRGSKTNIMSVVPGTTLSSDEYMMQHANDEIVDLHDEIRRMNIRQRRREGSISVSGSNCSDSEIEEIERPQNPEPVIHRDKANKNRSMEEVIDGLYLKTQKKLDVIYQNGIGNIETYRQESSIEDPDMNKFEQDLFATNDVADSNIDKNQYTEVPLNDKDTKGHRRKDKKVKSQRDLIVDSLPKESAKIDNESSALAQNSYNENAEEQRIDSLLNEVSIWAKDRENWLLGRTELGNKYDESKDQVTLSHKIDLHNGQRSRADLIHSTDEIDRVRASNEQRCNNWVDGKSNNPKCSQRTIDMITSPRLFTPRNAKNNVSETMPDTEQALNDNENSRLKLFSPRNGFSIPSHLNSVDKTIGGSEDSRAHIPTKRTHRGVPIIDYSESAVKEDKISDHRSKNKHMSILADKHNEHNKTIINGIVIPTPTFDSETEDDRSTINDDLSDLDHRVPFRARSPDSWLSSCGSPTTFLRKPDSGDNDLDDSFETVSSLRADSANVVRVAVANAPDTTNNTERQKPHTHAPYRGLDREGTPMPNDSQHIPIPQSLARNTQLQPITSQSFRQEKNINPIQRLNSMNGINSLTGLPSMLNDGILKGTRNLKDFELSMNIQSRPFSEITLPNSSSNGMNGNTRLMGNSGNFNGMYQIQPVPADVSVLRPQSETFQVKRTDKVGMGQVMATDSNRERNRYAKEIVHSMERQRQQPQKAFANTETNDINKKEDLAFISQLLKGGYSYDKHSSQRLNSASAKNTQSSKDLNNLDSNTTNALTKQDQNDTSTSDKNATGFDRKSSFKLQTHTHISISGSTQHTNNVSLAKTKISTGYTYDYSINPLPKSKDSSALSSVEAVTPRETTIQKNKRSDEVFYQPISESAVQAKMGRTRLEATSTASQSSISQTTNKTTEQISHGSVSTAEKLRNRKNRKSQEMQWLMKDAAETEV